MARIPDDELARIKRETYLVAQAQAGEVELRRHGPNLIGRCLWHDDQTARLIITPGKNLWRCMGACQVGGSAIDWRCALDEIPARPRPAQRVRRAGARSPGGVAWAALRAHVRAVTQPPGKQLLSRRMNPERAARRVYIAVES